MTTIEKLVDVIIERAQDRDRYIVAIAGPPGSGKSTVTKALCAQINNALGAEISIVVPMDGFHLDNSVLDKIGARHVKGAPHTFDAEGFVELVRAIAIQSNDISIPEFDREEDKVIHTKKAVSSNHKIILIEGNYLLLEETPWGDLKQYFDMSAMLLPPTNILEERLIARWLEHGYSPDEAKTKAYSNDIPNAKYVLANSSDAEINLSEVEF